MPGRDSLWLQGARSVDAAKFVLAEGRPTDRPSARQRVSRDVVVREVCEASLPAVP